MDLRLRHIAQRIESLGAGEGGNAEPVFAGIQEIGDGPVSPNIVKIVLVSLLGGGVLAWGVPALAGLSRRGRGKITQLGTSLGLPVLGTIPALRKMSPRVPVLADAQDERLAPLGKSFHELRGSLLSMRAVPRVVMVTSALPGEGKTVVAANLGIAFADSGVRTLLIDTDVPRGRLHRLFGYRPAPGLGNVLAGQIPAEKAVRPTPHQHLHVLNAARGAAPNAEWIASEIFAKTITQFREAFDLVILDAPPLLGFSAAAALASHADVVLLVVSPTRASRQAAAEVLRGGGVKVSGLVVNRAAE